MICAPIFSPIPYIELVSTKARGNVTSMQLPDGWILLVTKYIHLLAFGYQLVLVMPSVVAQ